MIGASRSLRLSKDWLWGPHEAHDVLPSRSRRTDEFEALGFCKSTQASAANTLTGPLVDQAGIVADFAAPTIQSNASEAIHRFIA